MDVLSADAVAQLLATAEPEDPASEFETGAHGDLALDPQDAIEAMSLVNQAVAAQQPGGQEDVAAEPAVELLEDEYNVEDASGAMDAEMDAEVADEVVAGSDHDMTAEMEIPEPVAEHDDQPEPDPETSDPKSVVADALEEVLEAMAAGEAVVVEDAVSDQ